MQSTRRQFLSDVGKGMLLSSIGPVLAADLGFDTALADGPPARLTFGNLERLVGLLEETGPDKILPTLAGCLRRGTDIGQLVGAGALANARMFGGDDYVGFHTMMALSPAYSMARELPEGRRPLPVFKVLYRNSNRIAEKGGAKNEVLRPVRAPAAADANAASARLRDQVHRTDLAGAEQTFASLAQGSPEGAYNQLMDLVEEGTEVHRVVMAYRAWDLLGLVGKERAHTMLRQSVHYCVRNENESYRHTFGGARAVLPKLLDQYRLEGRPRGTRPADDGWVDRMSETIFASSPERAAEAAAGALAEGIVPEAIGEAIALAANQLVLRDNGRPPSQTSANKPVGSVHGDGIGVHACDSANAWRNITRFVDPRHAVACLILGAYQVAHDRITRGGDFLRWEPYPRADARERVRGTDPRRLLQEAESAIRAKDQADACALVSRYGALGYPPRPVLDLLLRYAISEDGALHAEKYYRTATEEFAAARPAFRWRQLVALARVTASEYGQPAPGYAESCRLLGV